MQLCCKSLIINERMKNMKLKKRIIGMIMAVCMLFVATACGNSAEGTKDAKSSNAAEKAETPRSVTVTDMADRQVTIEGDMERVVIIEWEAMAAKTLKKMGLADTIVGIDDYAAKNTFRNYVIPEFANAKDIGSAWSGINYEALAELKPDVVFLELWVTSEDEQKLHDECIEKLESMGIPVVCFLSPSCFETPNIETAWQHIRLVGQVMNQEAEAEKIIQDIKDKVDLIRERTSKLSEDEKKDAIIFATANYVMGPDTVQSYFLTDIINANNMVKEGGFVNVSEEQLLKYNPDSLIIIGHDGYLDPSIVEEGKMCGINWGNVQEVSAIKNKNYICLGYEEWRDTLETPVTLLKMAKLVYPELFEDIDIEKEEINMYMNDYGMSEEEAKKAIEAQHYTGQLEDPK